MLKGEGHAKTIIMFLALPFAQEMSFFSAFLHGFNSGSKNSSAVGGVIRDASTRTFFGISIDRTVKSLCALGYFKSHSEGISS